VQSAGSAPPPARGHARHELRRHRGQALIVDAAAACHVVMGELPGLHRHLVGHALVPERAGIRRRDDLVHDGPAGALEACECRGDIRAGLSQRAIQRDGILECQASA